MDISYLFPIFKDDDCKTFFKKFLKSNFFISQNNLQILTFVNKDDKKNLDELKKLSKENKLFKIYIFENEFSYNEAFLHGSNLSRGDILLLGDVKIPNIDLLFSKCLEKHNKGAHIVHVVKRKKGIKNFFNNIFQFFYKFFIKLYTDKRDRFNEVSLGLYSKDVLDVLNALPTKSCFLKNTKDLFGFTSKTIYINDDIKTYDVKLSTMTSSLKTVIISSSLNIAFLLAMIILNIFVNKLSVLINIFLVMGLFTTLMISFILLPNHIFVRRNKCIANTKVYEYEEKKTVKKNNSKRK